MGGKRSLVDLHYNHRVSLATIRPVINSFEPRSPSPLIAQKSFKSPNKLVNEYAEVEEAFRRVAQVKKGYTNSLTPPDTFNMR